MDTSSLTNDRVFMHPLLLTMPTAYKSVPPQIQQKQDEWMVRLTIILEQYHQ